MALGQRVAVVHAGRLQQVDTPPALAQRPANRIVAAFLGSPPMNFIPGRVEILEGHLVFTAIECGIRVGIPDGQASGLESRVGKPVELGLRPENLSPLTAGSPPGTIPLARGRLVAVEPLGTGSQWWDVQVGPLTITCLGGIQTCPGLDSEVPIEADLTQCHWFGGVTGERIERGLVMVGRE
jgi:multiple sugar transport system ATP-binding protein